MSRASLRKPSPALVISLLALFVALGGSAYAATKIGTKDIKANAITAGKIKKNAVTSAKIKKDAVTGSKIKESTLGAVPNATNAVNATNATNFSRYFTSGLKKASPGADTNLGSIGPFSFLGKCKDIGGGESEATVVATTSAAGSFEYTPEFITYSEGDFNPGIEAQLSYGAESGDKEWGGYSARYDSFSVASPDGSVLLEGIANSGGGVFGAPCSFQISWTNGA